MLRLRAETAHSDLHLYVSHTVAEGILQRRSCGCVTAGTHSGARSDAPGRRRNGGKARPARPYSSLWVMLMLWVLQRRRRARSGKVAYLCTLNGLFRPQNEPFGTLGWASSCIHPTPAYRHEWRHAPAGPGWAPEYLRPHSTGSRARPTIPHAAVGPPCRPRRPRARAVRRRQRAVQSPSRPTATEDLRDIGPFARARPPARARRLDHGDVGRHDDLCARPERDVGQRTVFRPRTASTASRTDSSESSTVPARPASGWTGPRGSASGRRPWRVGRRRRHAGAVPATARAVSPAPGSEPNQWCIPR